MAVATVHPWRGAGASSGLELTAEIGLDELDGLAFRHTQHRVDPKVLEHLDGPRSHASGQHCRDALRPEPRREDAMLVRRRDLGVRRDDRASLVVDLEDGKAVGATEVGAEAAFEQGNCDSHFSSTAGCRFGVDVLAGLERCGYHQPLRR